MGLSSEHCRISDLVAYSQKPTFRSTNYSSLNYSACHISIRGNFMHKRLTASMAILAFAFIFGCATSSEWKYNKFQEFSGPVSTANTPSASGRLRLSLLSQDGKSGYSNISFSIPAQQVTPKNQFKCIAGKSQISIEIDGYDFGEISGKCQSRDTITGISDENKIAILNKIKKGKTMKLKSVAGDSYTHEDVFNIYGLIE